MNEHERMLEDVAVYSLGALPANSARQVALHIKTCDECRREYRRLRPAVTALGVSAEACADAASASQSVAPPSEHLKRRIMREVRPDLGQMRAVRPIVWPAYAVAAACLAAALITGVFNISLNADLRENQQQLDQLALHNAQITRQLAFQRSALSDLVSPSSQHFAVRSGEVIRHGARLYLAMDALPPPPKGKVYQAWTLRSGATTMSPSVTFLPNSSGVAVVPIPVNALRIAAVAVSIEPEGGSKQPTSKPTFVLKLA